MLGIWRKIPYKQWDMGHIDMGRSWENHGEIPEKMEKKMPFQWENHEKSVILLGFEWGKYMVIYSENDHVGFE